MSNWKNIVGSLAPTIATALGGPLAGTAVKYLSKEFLGTDNATESELAAAISGAPPERLAQIRQIDADFKVKMEQIGVDIFALEIDDRKNARAMAKVNMIPQIVLSTIFVLGYFAILVLLMSGVVVIADEIKDALLLLLGLITREIPTIMQFWFGSSHGSKNKSDNK